MPLPITYLFVPGDRPDRFAKALAAGADRVILDLEDAVTPDRKADARVAIRSAQLDWQRVAIRVNPADSRYWRDDLATVAATGAATVVIPKAERASDLEKAAAVIGRPIEVLPQIETAQGLDVLDELLAAPGVRRVAFGHLDFALDIGAEPEWEALTLARQRLVWRSRLAEREAPVDSVTVMLDPERTKADAQAASAMGFAGKLLIHPAQVAPARAAFAPGAAQMDWARRVLEALAEGGAGAVALDGKMIDKPVEDAARRILSKAGEL